MSELRVTNPEEYGALTTEQDESELVPMPSGAVFKLRRADIQGMVLIGALPQSLVNEGLAAWKRQGKAESIVNSISEQSSEETIQQLIFMRQTVVQNVLEPRIGFDHSGVVSLFNLKGEAVAPLKKQDFTFAFRWITRQEGKEADGLSNFRNGRTRAISDPVPDVAGHRDEAVELLAGKESGESVGVGSGGDDEAPIA